jgi:hypothetical protein
MVGSAGVCALTLACTHGASFPCRFTFLFGGKSHEPGRALSWQSTVSITAAAKELSGKQLYDMMVTSAFSDADSSAVRTFCRSQLHCVTELFMDEYVHANVVLLLQMFT